MGEVRSAAEIAREKAEKLGKATDEERLKWKYVPEGEKLAAKYLNQDGNLSAELDGYEGNAVKYVIEGAVDILARNIGLPKNDATRQSNKRAMDGLKLVKNDKIAVENVYSKMRRVFSHYTEQGEQQKKQAYAQLKVEIEARVKQAMQQQLGSSVGFEIDVERQPQFQEEWRKLQAQLDLQYIKLLDEYRQELLAIP